MPNFPEIGWLHGGSGLGKLWVMTSGLIVEANTLAVRMYNADSSLVT